MTSAATREALRSREQSYEDAQLVCRALTSNESLALATPQVRPEPTYAEAFERAMQALTGPDWQGFAQQSVDTVKNSPAQFGQAALSGVWEYVKGEFEGVVELGRSVAGWTSDFAKCTYDIGPGGLVDPDVVLRSEKCRPFHDTAASIQSISDIIGELTALGVAGVLELVREMLSLAIEVFDAVLREGLQLLGDQAEAIKEWLLSTSRNVVALGEIVGTLIGAILIEVGTAGVGRAVKAANLVRRLPGGPGALRSPITPVATDDTILIATMTFPSVRAISSTTRKRLDDLADVFQHILNKHGKRFSKNLTVAKLRILKKYIPEKEFRRFKRMRKAMAEAIAEEFRELQGTVKAYKDSVDEVREYTRRVLAFHYSDAVVGEDTLDYWNILARKDAVLPNVFEANHIIEARMFERLGRTQWRREFDLLGWRSTADMESVLMTADEHTGSVRAMLRRHGLTDAEVNEIAPPESVTRALLNRIKFKDDLTGPPGEGVLVIDNNTSFATLLSKYEEIYKAESPDLWNKSLRGKFLEWRNKLGLPAP